MVHFRKPFTYLAPILTRSPNGPKWDSTWPTSPRCSIGCVQNDFQACGTFEASHAPIMRQDYHYRQMDRNKNPLEPRHLRGLSGVSKMFSETMVRLAQTMHQSCTHSNTVYKWTKMGFHMTHVTSVFYPVCLKWFSSLWYVRHKPCTYLALTLALFLCGPKRASTWASSPRSTIRCIQNYLWAYGMFCANCAPFLHSH
jgi:hypothetical protein